MRHFRPSVAACLFAPLLAASFLGCASGRGAAQGSEAAAPAGDLEATCRGYSEPNSSGINPPRQLSAPQPEAGGWPAGSYACVRVTIDSAGSVVQPMVVKTNSDEFAKAFVRALGSWQYEPATRGTAKVTYHTALLARAPGG